MKKKISVLFVVLIFFCPAVSLGAESKCLEGDCFTGKGVMQNADGEKYSGEFKGGKRHGHGILTSKDGTRYEGGWANDLENGQGTRISPDGKKYIGEFERLKKENPAAGVFIRIPPEKSTWVILRTASMTEAVRRPFRMAEHMLAILKRVRPRVREH
jgi:hypothetical protein